MTFYLFFPLAGKPILAQEGQSVPGAGKFITYGDVTKFILEQCLEQGEWKKKVVSIGTWDSSASSVLEKYIFVVDNMPALKQAPNL